MPEPLGTPGHRLDAKFVQIDSMPDGETWALDEDGNVWAFKFTMMNRQEPNHWAPITGERRIPDADTSESS